MSEVARTLAAAVAAAYRLPDLEWTSEVATDEASGAITQEQWLGRFSDIQSVVGEWGAYWAAPKAYRVTETTGEPDLREEFFDQRLSSGTLPMTSPTSGGISATVSTR